MSGYSMSIETLQTVYGDKPDGHPTYTRARYEAFRLRQLREDIVIPSYWEWVYKMTRYTFLDPSKGLF
jgi:hypothetical protein